MTTNPDRDTIYARDAAHCTACGSPDLPDHHHPAPRRRGRWLAPIAGGVTAFILGYLFDHALHLPWPVGGPIAAVAGALVILAGTRKR